MPGYQRARNLRHCFLVNLSLTEQDWAYVPHAQQYQLRTPLISSTTVQVIKQRKEANQVSVVIRGPFGGGTNNLGRNHDG